MRLLMISWLLLQVPAGTFSDGDLRDALTAKYARKLMTVRGFPEGMRVRFDEEGNLVKGTPGVFTVDGSLHVDSVNVAPDRVQIRGRHVFLGYNSKTRKLEEVLSGSRMTLEFRRKAGIPVERGIDAAIVPFEELFKIVPAYWAKVLSNNGLLQPVVDPVTGVAIPRAKPSQGLAPKTLKKVQPVSPQTVQSLDIGGSVILRVITDERGKPQVADLVEPLGFGLDQAAIDAINQWEFEPAREAGKPVKVYFRVRVTFGPPR